jgi:hypothetical protein
MDLLQDLVTEVFLISIFTAVRLLCHFVSDAEDFQSQKTTALRDVLFKISHDAQSRLLFRAQTYLRNDLQNFKSSTEDLNYPARFEGVFIDFFALRDRTLNGCKALRDANTTTVAVEDVNSVDETDSALVSTNGQEEQLKHYFPTLGKTIFLLSRLNQCVHVSVFEDISQEAVDLCLQSLISSSASISSKQVRKNEASKIERC